MAPAIAVEIALSEGENQTLERKEGPVHSNRLLIDATGLMTDDFTDHTHKPSSNSYYNACTWTVREITC